MATIEAGAEPRRRPPHILYKVLNPLLGLILRSPLHGPLSEKLALLSYTGRKSGKSYTLPVAYVQGDARTILLGTQSGWKVNLRGGARVELLLRGRWRAGTSDLVEDQGGMVALSTTMIARAPQYGEITGVALDADGKANAADVATARERGTVVVVIDLD